MGHRSSAEAETQVAHRQEQRAKRAEEIVDALTVIGTFEGRDVYVVNRESRSPARQRVSDTLCFCGGRMNDKRFVLCYTGRWAHLECLEPGEPGPAEPDPELF
jgi:hypothetical protein